MKVLIPPGMMVASGPRNELPFPIVLCTGEGMLSIAPGAPLSQHDDKTAPAKPEAPCLFAANALAAPPPVVASVLEVAFVAIESDAPTIVASVTPGRGVSGPPLPARGPPIQLT
ncbi:hypothetical protein [Caulobacter sp.]|uniref:hypothetical protein n=1 Tax=Caulobacter sp. TaxID=78 RepID=UPI0031CEBF69